MNINIKMSDCAFYVNKDKKTVVCVIPCCEDDLYYFVRERWYDGAKVGFDMSDKLTERMTMPTSFMGKAVCSDEDEWDEEFGREIAFYRAKEKYYRSFFKRAREFMLAADHEMERLCDDLNAIGDKITNKLQHMEDHIKERAGE